MTKHMRTKRREGWREGGRNKEQRKRRGNRREEGDWRWGRERHRNREVPYQQCIPCLGWTSWTEAGRDQGHGQSGQALCRGVLRVCTSHVSSSADLDKVLDGVSFGPFHTLLEGSPDSLRLEHTLLEGWSSCRSSHLLGR